jgi:hypothetical protein
MAPENSRPGGIIGANNQDWNQAETALERGHRAE